MEPLGNSGRFIFHTSDDTYKKSEVNTELDALESLGFPVGRQELPGTHYDDAKDVGEANSTSGHIQADLIEAHMNDNWSVPVGVEQP